MKKLLSDVVLVSGAIFTISVGALITALTAQYVFGLEPCELCIYQRVPYCVTAVLAVVSLALTHNSAKLRLSAFVIFLCAVLFLLESGLAFFHTGVEHHLWKSPLEGCAADIPQGLTGDELVKFLTTRKPVRCDEVQWADPVLHISMAGYNTILALFMTAFSLIGSILVARRANGVLSFHSESLEKPANSNEPAGVE